MSNNQLIKITNGLVKATNLKHGILKKIANELDNPLPELIPYRKGDKWGFCDKKKNIIIECMYDIKAWYYGTAIFSECLVEVYLNGKGGYINNKGEQVLPFIYDFTTPFKDGLAIVTIKEQLYGQSRFNVINENGNIIAPNYFRIFEFSEGLALASKFQELDYGFINEQGEEVIPMRYGNMTSSFSEGFAKVQKDDGTYGFIDKKGNEAFDCKYGYGTKSFSDGLACVNKSVRMHISSHRFQYGFIDKKGNEVIECKYYEAESFSEGLAKVRMGHKYGFIDKDGNEVIPSKFEDALSFSEGLASVRLNDKYGAINKNGDIIIPYSFDYLSPFSENLAAVRSDGKYGFIDKNGKEVIPCMYEKVKSFKNSIVEVDFQGNRGFIDKNGTEYWED